jgi:Family of unknown function (DUF6174)
MKSSVNYLLGTGLLIVAGLPLLAAHGTGHSAAQPANQLYAVTAQATPITPQAPSPLPPDMGAASIANFTRADYEAALAKWRAQDVTEYQVEVTFNAFSPFGGPWRLTVARDGGREFVTSFQRLGEGGKGSGQTAQDLAWLTIGNIFDQVDRALSNVENPSSGNLAYDYSASFHPTLGYPVSFSAKPREMNVADADFAFSVQSVTIMQTGVYVPSNGGVVPGMPSTGHPAQ